MNLPEALRRLADELDDVEPTLADDEARVEQRIAASLQTLHRQLVHDQLDTLYDLDTTGLLILLTAIDGDDLWSEFDALGLLDE